MTLKFQKLFPVEMPIISLSHLVKLHLSVSRLCHPFLVRKTVEQLCNLIEIEIEISTGRTYRNKCQSSTAAILGTSCSQLKNTQNVETHLFW